VTACVRHPWSTDRDGPEPLRTRRDVSISWLVDPRPSPDATTGRAPWTCGDVVGLRGLEPPDLWTPRALSAISACPASTSACALVPADLRGCRRA
jgi:hypothetical protein